MLFLRFFTVKLVLVGNNLKRPKIRGLQKSEPQTIGSSIQSVVKPRIQFQFEDKERPAAKNTPA